MLLKLRPSCLHSERGSHRGKQAAATFLCRELDDSSGVLMTCAPHLWPRVQLLERGGVELDGKSVVVMGDSNIVSAATGWASIALLLLNAGAGTVAAGSRHSCWHAARHSLCSPARCLALSPLPQLARCCHAQAAEGAAADLRVLVPL